MTRSFSHNIGDYPDGIVLPIDKPYRWTSADVIRKVKYAAIRHFGKKNLKVGHAGTLDPLATGILLVCIGPATKRAEDLQRSAKEYIAGVSFGAVTPSYDLEKDIERRCPLDGVRAYETARRLLREAQRAGRAFDPGDILRSSRICIHELELLSWHAGVVQDFTDDGRGRIRVADVSGLPLPTAQIRVACSKGTYIRALARDLGEALGSGAFLSSLRRTKNGGFTIEDAVSLEEALEMLA